MKLSGKEARAIVNEDSFEWDQVGKPTIENTTRWSIVYSSVHKHIASGKCYEFTYSRGATESQEERPYEYDDEVDVCEVELRDVTEKRWVSVTTEKETNLRAEIAAIWARLQADRPDDALQMTILLTAKDERDPALKEMLENDTSELTPICPVCGLPSDNDMMEADPRNNQDDLVCADCAQIIRDGLSNS
jgi:hypothetical protein